MCHRKAQPPCHPVFQQGLCMPAVARRCASHSSSPRQRELINLPACSISILCNAVQCPGHTEQPTLNTKGNPPSSSTLKPWGSMLLIYFWVFKTSWGWSTGALSSFQAQALGLIQKVLLNRFLYSFFFERACLSKTILNYFIL